MSRNNVTESGKITSDNNLICRTLIEYYHLSYTFHNKVQKICDTPYITKKFKKDIGYLKYKKLHDLYPE